MSARGLVLTDGAGATEIGVDQTRAKVALYGPDGTTPLTVASGDSATDARYLPVSGRGPGHLYAVNVDRRGALELGELDVVVWDAINGGIGTAPDIMYAASASTFAPTYLADGYRLNATGNTGNGAFAHVKTLRTFPLQFGRPLTYILRAKVTPGQRPFAGAIAGAGVFSEIGFFDSSAPTNQNIVGAFFQIQNSVMTPVVATNNANQLAKAHLLRGSTMEFVDWGGHAGDGAGYLDPRAFYEWQVIVDLAGARFIIRDTGGEIVFDETIRCPATLPRLWTGGVSGFQAGARNFNIGNPITAGDLHMAESAVGYYGRTFQGRSWATQASEHRPTVRNPISLVAAPIWTNSAEPASQTLAQATSVFGVAGKFQFAAPAGAVTDFGIMSPPSLTTSFTGGLNITGISIDTWNVGAVVATTRTHLQWFLIPNGTSASAASSTARFALGSQSFAVGTPIGGTPDNQIVRSFQSPLCLRSSVGQTRWFTLGCRIAVGTATASQVIAGFISIEGYWE